MRYFSHLFKGLLIIVVTASFSQAAAQGVLSAGYLTQDTGEADYLFGDFTLQSGSDGWGGEIGMFGVVGRLHESYAAATYSDDMGTFSVGFPRPVFDSVAVSTLTTIVPRYALESIGTSRSRATYGTMFEPEFLPYGATFVNTDGQGYYGISVHVVPDTDVVILGGAAQLKSAEWTYEIGAEAVSEDDDLDWNTKARVARQFEGFGAAIGMYHPAANDQPDLAELSAFGDIWPDTALTGLVRMTEVDHPEFGLGLRTGLSPNTDLEVGVVRARSATSAASAALTFQF